jgi:Lrp/AsnC family leucine-responsive transcriptional regulator
MLDQTDQLILDELSQNSRITMKELGEKVHMTGQACAARVAKLEDSGVIERYTIKMNHEKLGYPIHVMITVFMISAQHQAYLAFVRSYHDYVIHNYKISGGGCYNLECKFTSNEVLDHFLVELNQYANYKLSVIISETT